MNLTTDEMTCKELVELVTEYLEETLPQTDRVRFDKHLSDCPYCHTYLEQMRETICLLGNLPTESIAPEARQDLLEVFKNWKKKS